MVFHALQRPAKKSTGMTSSEFAKFASRIAKDGSYREFVAKLKKVRTFLQKSNQFWFEKKNTTSQKKILGSGCFFGRIFTQYTTTQKTIQTITNSNKHFFPQIMQLYNSNTSQNIPFPTEFIHN